MALPSDRPRCEGRFAIRDPLGMSVVPEPVLLYVHVYEQSFEIQSTGGPGRAGRHRRLCRQHTRGRQIRVSHRPRLDLKTVEVTVTPCERINVGFHIGTQGQIFPTWGVSGRPAKKVVKFVRGGYENTNNTDGTTTQYFLYQAVGSGHTTVRFCESTASEPGCLETYKLQVTVRRARR